MWEISVGNIRGDACAEIGNNTGIMDGVGRENRSGKVKGVIKSADTNGTVVAGNDVRESGGAKLGVSVGTFIEGTCIDAIFLDGVQADFNLMVYTCW